MTKGGPDKGVVFFSVFSGGILFVLFFRFGWGCCPPSALLVGGVDGFTAPGVDRVMFVRCGRGWRVVVAVSGFGFTNGGTVIHISFGMPLSRGNGVASSAHVHNTLPALGGILTSNNDLVVVSRVNGPGNGMGTGCSLDRVISTISRGLNMPIRFTPSYTGTNSTTTTLGPNRILLLRGLHFCPRRRKGPINVSGRSPTCRSTGGTVGTSRGRFTGALTSCTSYCVGSTFNATRHGRTSATIVTSCFSTSGGVLKCLVRGRIRTISGVLGSVGHPFATVVNNSGISAGVNVVRGLVSGISGLVLYNNVACAFTGTRNKGVNGSVMRSSGLSLTLSVVTGTGTGNIGLMLNSSYITTSTFSGSTRARIIPTGGVPSK